VAKAHITVGGSTIEPGQQTIIDLSIADLYTHTKLTLPIHAINSKRAGPTLFLTAAIHGDELNGVEIIRRVMRLPELKRMRGQLIAVPVVNVFGFLNRTRYLPDRRDLNRSFPGSEKGSIAARLAHLLATEVLSQAQYGIDLHTGAIDRENLPQIRADLSDPRVLALAREFGAPVIIDSKLRDGSLRHLARDQGIPMLLYEAGEALRFDEVSIRAGVRGVRRVMRALGMLPRRINTNPRMEPVISRTTSWERAPRSGILVSNCKLGERVRTGQVLCRIGDPMGQSDSDVVATSSGVVIGKSNLPLAHEGDALFHIAQFEDSATAEATVEEFTLANAARQPT
jgi:hypothetical protein